MNSTARREKLRGILAGERCVHPASVFDPLSARIAEELGFEIGMLAGSVASLVVLGEPDLVLLTLTEFAEQAHRICRAGGLPLFVDADHGYGNALNVRRSVEELETAGVAGLSIEDTLLPPPFGRSGKAELTSIEEAVGKLRAGLDARRDRGLVIAGRTSVAATSGLDDLLARATAYAATGVDALFLAGIRSRKELDAVASTVRIPIILGAAKGEIDDTEYLESRGVRICLQGHLPFAAAVSAVYDSLKALRDGSRPEKMGASKDVLNRLSRSQLYDRWMKEFLGRT
ncbi:MAG: isocitrate lyase/PEP mutase family protein [Proteobacteria bacterium]|nr:isocitrate lyase/PEP mutase family protein [Pseudomonadota bacterium]